MSPNFEQYIRWTGLGLQFVISNPIVTFTEWNKRKNEKQEPTTSGDPAVRWKGQLITQKKAKNAEKSVYRCYYRSNATENRNNDMPFIEKSKGVKHAFYFDGHEHVCVYLGCTLEQLQEYVRQVAARNNIRATFVQPRVVPPSVPNVNPNRQHQAPPSPFFNPSSLNPSHLNLQPSTSGIDRHFYHTQVSQSSSNPGPSHTDPNRITFPSRTELSNQALPPQNPTTSQFFQPPGDPNYYYSHEPIDSALPEPSHNAQYQPYNHTWQPPESGLSHNSQYNENCSVSSNPGPSHTDQNHYGVPFRTGPSHQELHASEFAVPHSFQLHDEPTLIRNPDQPDNEQNTPLSVPCSELFTTFQSLESGIPSHHLEDSSTFATDPDPFSTANYIQAVATFARTRTAVFSTHRATSPQAPQGDANTHYRDAGSMISNWTAPCNSNATTADPYLSAPTSLMDQVMQIEHIATDLSDTLRLPDDRMAGLVRNEPETNPTEVLTDEGAIDLINQLEKDYPPRNPNGDEP